MRAPIILAVVAMATYFGYYFLPISARAWAYYPAQGLLCAVAGHICRGHFVARHVATDRRDKRARLAMLAGVAGGSLMIGEGVQQFGCGLIDARSGGVDVCRHALGSDLHMAIVSLVGAALVMVLWPNPQPRR